MNEINSYKNLRFYEIDGDKSWENVLLKYGHRHSELNRPFKAILEILKHHCGNNKKAYVIEESGYIDIDYRSEFSTLYSKTFQKHESSCNRLHFFSTKVATKEDIIGVSKKNSEGYLGYVIIRPTPVGKPGRTVIKPWSADPLNEFVRCKATHFSHLLGIKLAIEGTAFIQQDAMVMACAQASIWMAAMHMHVRDNFPRPLPSQITSSATQSLGFTGRAYPTSGLTIEQMLNALNDLGLTPVLYPTDINTFAEGLSDEQLNQLRSLPTREEREKELSRITAVETVKLIFPYLESEIPVITVLPRYEHAVTAIGYILGQNCHKGITGQPFNSVSQLIVGLIVQDDAGGPYQIMPVSRENMNHFQNQTFRNSVIHPRTVEDIDYLIVPLPEKVYLLPEDFEEHTIEFLQDEQLINYLTEPQFEKNPFFDELTNALRSGELFLRSYMIPSQEYKELVESGKEFLNMHPLLKQTYKEMPSPRYLCITELSTMSNLIPSSNSERFILGELIMDSTANKYGKFIMSIHLPGKFLKCDLSPETSIFSFKETASLNNDKPYEF